MIYDLLVDRSAKPRDWRVVAIRDLADVFGGGTPDTDVPAYWNPPEVPWVTPTDITASTEPVLLHTERSISLEGLKTSSAALLPVGTTLLTSRATVGECKIAGVQVATNQGFASLVPKETTDPDFLFYLAQFGKPAFVRLAAGTTFTEISRREVRRIKVCIPTDPDEILTIGQALKAADAAIRAVQTELSKAQRVKAALFQQLFTKGLLGRHGHFKESKIGSIPASWDCVRLRTIVDRIDAGSSPQCETNPARVGRWGVLKVSAVSWDEFDETENKELPPDIEPELAAEVMIGDIIVSRANTPGLAGAAQRVRRLKNKLLLCDKTWRVVPRNDVDPEWFLGVLKCQQSRRQIESLATGTSDTMKNVSQRDFMRMWIPLPEESERADMGKLIRRSDEFIDAMRIRLERIRRLKKSLLQDLPTGRLRLGKGAPA